jgi:hypothetical protein
LPSNSSTVLFTHNVESAFFPFEAGLRGVLTYESKLQFVNQNGIGITNNRFCYFENQITRIWDGSSFLTPTSNDYTSVNVKSTGMGSVIAPTFGAGGTEIQLSTTLGAIDDMSARGTMRIRFTAFSAPVSPE